MNSEAFSELQRLLLTTTDQAAITFNSRLILMMLSEHPKADEIIDMFFDMIEDSRRITEGYINEQLEKAKQEKAA